MGKLQILLDKPLTDNDPTLAPARPVAQEVAGFHFRREIDSQMKFSIFSFFNNNRLRLNLSLG